MKNIELDINPLVSDLRNIIEKSVNTAAPGVAARALEEVEANKEILVTLTEGILKKEITADFAIKRLKEIPENILHFAKSEEVILSASAESIGKEILYKVITFINEKLTDVENAIDDDSDVDPA